MSDYWIKLYHEILDDPKMATMPDHLWRKTIELFLAAGRINNGGMLPCTKEIAWMLRVAEDELARDLEIIAASGIITKTETGWFINKFAVRQAKVPAAERQRQHRDREHRAQYYGDMNVMDSVTNVSQNVTQIRSDTDTDIDTDTPPRGAAKPRTNLLDRELACFLKGAAILSEDIKAGDFIDDYRFALRDIINSVHGGSSKFILACENLARAPDDDRRQVKSVTWLLEDRHKAMKRVIAWAAKNNGYAQKTIQHAPDNWRPPS